MQKVINYALSVEDLALKLNESLDSALFDIELQAKKFTKPTWSVETLNGEDFKKYMTVEEVGEVNHLLEKSYQRVSLHGYKVESVLIRPHTKSIGIFALPTELFEDENFSFPEFQELFNEYLLQIQKLLRPKKSSTQPIVSGISPMFGTLIPYFSFVDFGAFLAKKDLKNIEAIKTLITTGKSYWQAFVESIGLAIAAVDKVIEDNVKNYYSIIKAFENESDIFLRQQDVHVLYDNLYNYVIEYNKGWLGRIMANKKRGAAIPLCVEMAHYELSCYESVYVPEHLLLDFELNGRVYCHIKRSDLKFVMVPYQGVLDRLHDEGVKI